MIFVVTPSFQISKINSTSGVNEQNCEKMISDASAHEKPSKWFMAEK